ncbi:unnamed protein product [Blepharisma stoltei]|uniref:ATP synthase F0 subunit 8 n=1 Tax=Blepharisma stoltei TaxID=1481888 RepID=A0AAU9KAW7_9CILI|nr:unnamed protein product [Blepharisma stoltei]
MEANWAWYQLIIVLFIAAIIIWRIVLFIFPKIKEMYEEKARLENLNREKERLLGKRNEIQYHVDWATYNNDLSKAQSLTPSLEKIMNKISEIDASLSGKKSNFYV